MSGGGSSSGKLKPWGPAKPYMTGFMEDAQGLYQGQQPITPGMQAGLDAQQSYWGGSGVQGMIDQAGPRTWPIMGATYAIIPTRGLPVEQILSALRFVSWCYDSGYATLVLNSFQPLPELLKRRIRFTWRTVFVDARRKPLL